MGFASSGGQPFSSDHTVISVQELEGKENTENVAGWWSVGQVQIWGSGQGHGIWDWGGWEVRTRGFQVEGTGVIWRRVCLARGGSHYEQSSARAKRGLGGHDRGLEHYPHTTGSGLSGGSDKDRWGVFNRSFWLLCEERFWWENKKGIKPLRGGRTGLDVAAQKGPESGREGREGVDREVVRPFVPQGQTISNRLRLTDNKDSDF